MDENVNQLLAVAAAVAAISVGYGKVFGKYQCRLVEWLCTAMGTPKRFRGLLNLGTGVAVALLYSGFAAWQAEDLRLLALGGLAGVFASVEAADVHDQLAAKQPQAPEGATALADEGPSATSDLGAPNPLRAVP